MFAIAVDPDASTDLGVVRERWNVLRGRRVSAS